MRWALYSGFYCMVCDLMVDYMKSSLPLAFKAFTSHCMSSARSGIVGKQKCKLEKIHRYFLINVTTLFDAC